MLGDSLADRLGIHPRWLLCDDFVDINFGSPRFDHIQGFTIDIENVLSDGIDGGDPTVRPDALTQLATMQELGRDLILLTNCRDEDFTEAVTSQVNDELDRPIEALTKVEAGKSKVHPEIFFQAANRLGLASNRLGHIDDQFKSHIGAIRADFALKIWPKPWGEHEHAGVKRFRPVEMSVVRGLVRAYPRSRSL